MKFENPGVSFLDNNMPSLSETHEVKHEQGRRGFSNEQEAENSSDQIEDFLSVLERTHLGKGRHKEVSGLTLEKLKVRQKQWYYKRYIINSNNIPQTYWNLQAKIIIEQGRGADLDRSGVEKVEGEDKSIDYIFPEDLKESNIEAIQEDQKSSFDRWFDYLTSQDANVYPTWLKYWAFHGMTKLGSYNKERKEFVPRNKGTVAPFPDLSQEALAGLLDILILKYGEEYFEIYEQILDKKKELIISERQQRNKIVSLALDAGYIQNIDNEYLLRDDVPTQLNLDDESGRTINIKRKNLEKMLLNYVPVRNSEEIHAEVYELELQLHNILESKNLEDEIFHKDVLEEDFGELYSWAIENISSIEGEALLITEGSWVMFPQGCDPMLFIPENFDKPLVPSLQGRGTGWCTAGQKVAEEQLNGGDFYVYYSNNIHGKLENPRIAIRKEGEQIAEVRGIAENQNIDKVIVGTDILDQKLQTFGTEGQRYQKKDSDMRKLTEIHNKIQEGNELTRKDLRFLYELDGKIDGFGYEKDPRINEILNRRDSIRADIAYILEIDESQVSFDMEEFYKGDIIYHYGDFVSNNDELINKNLPRYIRGTLELEGCDNMIGFKLPKFIGGDLSLDYTKIDGFLFDGYIGGSIYLDNLEEVINTRFPEHVFEHFSLSSVTKIHNTVFPLYVGRDFSLDSAQYLSGVRLSEHIGDDLDLDSLKNAIGCILPKSIGKTFWCRGLQTYEGLELPIYIGDDIQINELSEEEKLVLLENYPGYNFDFC